MRCALAKLTTSEAYAHMSGISHATPDLGAVMLEKAAGAVLWNNWVAYGQTVNL